MFVAQWKHWNTMRTQCDYQTWICWECARVRSHYSNDDKQQHHFFAVSMICASKNCCLENRKCWFQNSQNAEWFFEHDYFEMCTVCLQKSCSIAYGIGIRILIWLSLDGFPVALAIRIVAYVRVFPYHSPSHTRIKALRPQHHHFSLITFRLDLFG